MPLINPSPTAPPEPKPDVIQIAKPLYRGVVVDTTYIPKDNLITKIDGFPWTVDYYSQVLDDDNAPSGQQPSQDPIYQQYTLVRGMEIKVTNPLTQTQDQTTKQFQTTGSAHLYPFITPNEGDMFIADIGDGRTGLFRINNTERKTIFKDSTFLVDYVLVDYLTPERRGDLNLKVVDTLVYVRDFMQYGQNPLVSEESFNLIGQLTNRYKEIASAYYKLFMSNEFKTLIVPGQEYPVYDHFLTKACQAIFSIEEAWQQQHCRILNADDDYGLKALSIWDALLNQDRNMMPSIFRQAGLITRTSFTRDAMLEGIYYSGIPYIVYPKDLDPSIEIQYGGGYVKMLDDQKIVHVAGRPLRPGDETDPDPLGELPWSDVPNINLVTADDHYIFSQAFYEQLPVGQSRLELSVRDYLNRKALDNRVLLTLANEWLQWGRVEQYYYIPILLILIRASIRSF